MDQHCRPECQLSQAIGGLNSKSPLFRHLATELGHPWTRRLQETKAANNLSVIATNNLAFTLERSRLRYIRDHLSSKYFRGQNTL